MKKIISFLLLALLVVACKENVKKEQSAEQTEEVVKTDVPTIAIADFELTASDYINKEIKVQGIVDHVCKHGGKKLLLVTDDGDVHVTSDVRFDEALKGSEIALSGIVVEERIDEAYCLKMEEDNIKSHSEGQTNDEQFEAKKKMIQQYRDQMQASNSDHISNYSLAYVSHKTVE